MFKIIYLLVLFLVIFLIVKSYQRKKRQKALASENKKSKSLKIVKCQQCGLHLPQKQATVDKGEVFCCLEHANQYRIDRSR